MPIKETLREVRKLYLEIEAKQRQREKLYYTVIGSNIKLKDVDVQTSISGDRLGDTMAEVADLDRSIREDLETLCNMQRMAANLFRKLSKPEHRAIMTDYYINAYTWDQVAKYNKYSVDNVYKMHGAALLELQSLQ